MNIGRKMRAPEAGGVSIADVAREAGVATSTVSRALTRPGRTSEVTRQKVLDAAKRLGYTANHAARSLRVGYTSTVMIVLPEALYVGASQVVLEVLRDTAEAFKELGFSLLISNVTRETTTDEHILDVAFGGSVSGVLLMGSPLPTSPDRNLMEAGLPVVSLFFDMTAQGIPSVVCDDYAAAESIVDALVEGGHRTFLYVQGNAGNFHEVKRHRGVRAALERAGLGPEALAVVPGDFNFSGGVNAGRFFLAMQDRPHAVICANDDMAIAFIKTVVDAGVRVPEDVSVIGYDDSPVAEFLLPSLATVRQPVAALGHQAAELIVDMITNRSMGPDAPIVIPCELILRDSVRLAPTARGE
jgi:LacI family transcriptional regulator, repressor for deo operon, udp, cdd, tsx, nupC, and nupG